MDQINSISFLSLLLSLCFLMMVSLIKTNFLKICSIPSTGNFPHQEQGNATGKFFATNILTSSLKQLLLKALKQNLSA